MRLIHAAIFCLFRKFCCRNSRWKFHSSCSSCEHWRGTLKILFSWYSGLDFTRNIFHWIIFPKSRKMWNLNMLNFSCHYSAFIKLIPYLHYNQDIVSKISSFAERGSRAICILSATGVVSSVVIRQPGLSGGILRYEVWPQFQKPWTLLCFLCIFCCSEGRSWSPSHWYNILQGRFEILSLCGSFTFDETSGANGKTGMLSVSLAKPDGRVFGGGIVGSLIASGPIQVGSSFPTSIFGERNDLVCIFFLVMLILGSFQFFSL